MYEILLSRSVVLFLVRGDFAGGNPLVGMLIVPGRFVLPFVCPTREDKLKLFASFLQSFMHVSKLEVKPFTSDALSQIIFSFRHGMIDGETSRRTSRPCSFIFPYTAYIEVSKQKSSYISLHCCTKYPNRSLRIFPYSATSSIQTNAYGKRLNHIHNLIGHTVLKLISTSEELNENQCLTNGNYGYTANSPQ